VFGVGESRDGQAVGSECGGSDDRDTGQAGQHLPISGGQQLGDLLVKLSDVGLQSLVAMQVASQPPGPLLAVCGRAD
jgi:hypothetical protein